MNEVSLPRTLVGPGADFKRIKHFRDCGGAEHTMQLLKFTVKGEEHGKCIAHMKEEFGSLHFIATSRNIFVP